MWKARKNARFTHHFREEFIIVKMAIREKFTRFKKIFTPGLLALPLLPTMLESPLWLLMKNRKEEAKSVLKRIRGQVYNVEPEILQIEEALRIKKGTFKDVVKTGSKPFVLLFFLMFFQTGSGCDTISIYALIIFSEFQLSGTVFSIILQVCPTMSSSPASPSYAGNHHPGLLTQPCTHGKDKQEATVNIFLPVHVCWNVDAGCDSITTPSGTGTSLHTGHCLCWSLLWYWCRICPTGPHVRDVSSEDKELGPGIQLVHQVTTHVPQYQGMFRI